MVAPSLMTAGSGPASPTRRVIVPCVVALLAGLVYLNALHNPFVYDDHRMIVENPSIRSLTNVKAIVWHDISRPLVNLTYAVDYALWGSGSFGFHVTNVLLHMVNVLLLFLVAIRLAADRRLRAGASLAARVQPEIVAIASSILLAVHPLMTEATGYISGRPEVLGGMLFLLAFLCARRSIQEGGARWWIGALALWILAMTAKESAAMFPLVILGYDAFLVRDDTAHKRRRLVRLHLPFIAIAVLAGVIRLAVLAGLEHPGQVSFNWRYALVELDVTRQYFLLFLFPHGQAIFHSIVPINSVFDHRALLAIAMLAIGLTLAWRARRVDGLTTFGSFWFVLLLVPATVLVVLDRGEPMSEHRVYTSFMGLFLAAGSGVGWLWAYLSTASRPAKVVTRSALALLLLLFCARTVFRNAIWGDPVMLWLEAAEAAPDQWAPRLALAEALQEAGRCPEAIPEYRSAIALRPQDPFPYARLGACLIEAGRLDDASAMFAKLKDLDSKSPLPAIGFGTIAMVRSESDEARRNFLEALDKDPANVAARRLLATVIETSDPREALRLCKEAQQLAPDTEAPDACSQQRAARAK